MTDIAVKLNAWEPNYVQVLAVQGESEGRTIIATLIDRTGQTDSTFNAESIDRPIDLAGTTVRLYCKKPDGTKTLSDGTITDAKNGKASFVLPEQATASAGDVSAQIYITKPDNSVLKVIGLTLQVESSDIEGIESSDDFTSLVEALNKAETAAELTEQAKEDSEAAVANANAAIGSIEQKNQEISVSEAARETAENGRVSAENTRESNEDARNTAETARAEAESTRESNESTRQTREQSRIDAETARADAESERRANETTRQSNEGARNSAEAERASAESARKTAEAGRVSAEADRESAESARADAESARQQNEQARQTQESGRVSAESARATAENQRQTDTAAAISNAETATTNANTAADRANTAAQNAEDAIAGQLDPAIDARIAAQKNQANGIAGLDENGKVATAQLPTMDYVPTSEKGATNGVATLDSTKKVPATQIPSGIYDSIDGINNALTAHTTNATLHLQEGSLPIHGTTGIDINTLTTPGLYRVQNPSTSYPPGYTSDSDFIVWVTSIAPGRTDYVQQTVYDVRSDKVWVHSCVNNTWGWRYFADGGNAAKVMTQSHPNYWLDLSWSESRFYGKVGRTDGTFNQIMVEKSYSSDTTASIAGAMLWNAADPSSTVPAGKIWLVK